MYQIDLKHLKKTMALPGDRLYPDEWPRDHELINPDATDRQFFGENVLRVQTGQPVIPTLPVRVKITGRKARWCYMSGGALRLNNWKVRCNVEFIRDGEPSEYSGGWLYFTEK